MTPEERTCPECGYRLREGFDLQSHRKAKQLLAKLVLLQGDIERDPDLDPSGEVYRGLEPLIEWAAGEVEATVVADLRFVGAAK